jgi:hypothetical protein
MTASVSANVRPPCGARRRRPDRAGDLGRWTALTMTTECRPGGPPNVLEVETVVCGRRVQDKQPQNPTAAQYETNSSSRVSQTLLLVSALLDSRS